MSISSSMNAGVAGLRANATRLATISDNIANSGTYGYRRANTSFHSMVVGSGGAGQGSYAAGGVRTSTTRLVDQGGTLIGTDNATDIALSGRGFLPVTTELGAQLQDGSAPLRLATTGSFRTDAAGLLKDSAGNTLLGVPAGRDGVVAAFPRDSAAALRPVRIDPNEIMFRETSRIDFAVNLPATETLSTATGDTIELSAEFFNTLGLSDRINIELEPTLAVGAGPSNTWTMTVSHPELPALPPFTLLFDATPGNAGKLASVTPAPGAYDPATGEITLMIGGQDVAFFIGGAAHDTGITQRGPTFSPLGMSQDGAGVGNFVGLTIDADGFLEAIYDQGFRRTLYRIPIIDVPNPNGLTSLSSQTFQVSRESGPFFMWDAGTGPVGEFIGFALQESATDVAAELTGLIQTQRAYSSNAKVIQTVDEMFQETTNIKR